MLIALGYFTALLFVSAFAPRITTAPVFGGLTAGLLLGLFQLPVTGLAIFLYERNVRRYEEMISPRFSDDSGSVPR